jgi:glycosyltransferase involved in cell wall biosynthesis
MKLSVIISTYNFSSYIQQCVDSVLKQKTDFEFEILVWDDASTDNSQKILKEAYGENPRVQLFFSEKNLGAYHTMSSLLNLAKGEYISHIDGDDYYTYPEKLQKQVDFLDANPDFFMHSTGYQGLDKDGQLFPISEDEGMFLWFCPMKQILTTKDLLDRNLVTFGRTFRNIPGLMKEWMKDAEYLDWAFNFECSFNGKIKCDVWGSGVYRISDSGMFSTKSDAEKNELNFIFSNKLKNIYANRAKKITIIDCFVRNERIETKLSNAIDKLKSKGEDVLLVSNLPPSSELIKKCDYFIYDSKNRLLQEEYTNVKMVDFHIHTGSFSIHNLRPGVQRHCLSVMWNLYNALIFSKNLGYTFFQRIEVDDIFGERSLEAMGNLFQECLDEKKLGCFFFNEDEKNISFHFFLSQIDFLLERIPRLESEIDYKNYLLYSQQNLDFVIAEEIVYNEITGSRDLLLSKDGKKMFENFPDTLWNTETSGSNLDPKFQDRVTGIYKLINKGETTGHVILSYNYGESPKQRKIRCMAEGKIISEFSHQLDCLGAWSYHHIPEGCEKISVFGPDDLLYEEENLNPISYISF